MVLSKTLEDAISKKNIVGIHSVFYTIAHEDPSFQGNKFRETYAYVKSLNIPGFIEEHDGTAFLAKEHWNEEYWATVVSEMQDNFSEERVNHLIQVGRHVYGKTTVEPSTRISSEKTVSGTKDENVKKNRESHSLTDVQKGMVWLLIVVLLLIVILLVVKRR